MRFKEFLLQEAPLKDYSHSGDFDWQNDKQRGHFQSTDRKLVKHPVHLEKMKKFFSKCPIDFVILVTNESKFHLDEKAYGLMDKSKMNELISEFGLTPDEAKSMFSNPGAITCVFSGNDSTDPMTPWIHAHRIGHMYDDATDGELSKWFIKIMSECVHDHYTLSDGSALGEVNDRLISYKLHEKLMTTRSARHDNLDGSGEAVVELFSQYILKGTVVLNEMPAILQSTGYIGKVFGKFSAEFDAKMDPKKVSDSLKDQINKKMEEVLKSMVGKVYIY